MNNNGLIGVEYENFKWYDSGNPKSWIRSQIDYALNREDLADDLLGFISKSVNADPGFQNERDSGVSSEAALIAKWSALSFHLWPLCAFTCSQEEFSQFANFIPKILDMAN